ncbi:hypothetical protein [Sphingomonas sp. ID0503]|uniref:hypothetical protein n=1 Tax=Sphingomonas sp. ID0503 TaxID=3399691 RepID=UPI003AFA916A
MKDDANYSIELCPTQGLVRMKLTGYWDDETSERFATELRSAIKKLEDVGVGRGEYLLFADLSESAIQSTGMADQLRRLAQDFGANAKRVAVIVSSTLLKLQVGRMSSGIDTYRVFGPEQASLAQGWLVDPAAG